MQDTNEGKHNQRSQRCQGKVIFQGLHVTYGIFIIYYFLYLVYYYVLDFLKN
jgi:hypothetical protein